MSLPQVLKEGDHPSFQLTKKKETNMEQGEIEIKSLRGVQQVKLRGRDMNDRLILVDLFFQYKRSNL